jgi:simple sugar transport system permease protein
VSTAAAPPEAPPAGPARPGAGDLLKRFLTLREGSIAVVTLLAILYFSLKVDRFFTSANFVTLLPYFAPFAILAVGEVLVMVQGEIDLSIGSVYLFCPFMFYEFNQAGLPLVACLIAALAVCAVVGLLNGVITEVFGVSSFITTLGMLLALAGLTLIISHAAPVEMPGAEVTSKVVEVHHTVNGQDIVLPERVNEVGTFAKIFGAGKYSELIWALIIVAGVQVLLTLTRWGMYTIAVGGNKHGAAEAGVKVRTVVIRNFILCSVFAGFVGILRDGLVLEGVNADYLDFILGVAILVAMIINVYVGRVRRGSGV